MMLWAEGTTRARALRLDMLGEQEAGRGGRHGGSKPGR